MVIGDLFSGIGGFSLAAHWMGWRTAWFSEIDQYASRVLAKHWPDVPNLGDITKVRWEDQPPVDLVTAGFPCQPHSVAGKRLASNDERDLFDEIIRCLRVVRPRFAVLENVPGLLTSESGRFFGRVLGALAACGYDAEWRVLAAADVGAPHERERVWIVGHAGGARGAARISGSDTRQEGVAGICHDAGLLSHWCDSVKHRGADGTVRRLPADAAQTGPQSPLWPVAHGIPGRVAQLRGIGNAIVPQCAVEIFCSITNDERMNQEAA